MPAGKALTNAVLRVLHPHHPKTMTEVRAELTMKATPRAVRYAMSNLITEGRARRTSETRRNAPIVGVSKP